MFNKNLKLLIIFLSLAVSACAQKIDVLKVYKQKDVPKSVIAQYLKRTDIYPNDIHKVLEKDILNKSVVDVTKILQDRINSFSKILLPNIPITISKDGLKLNNGQELYFQPNSILKIEANHKDGYQLLSIQDVNNVKVINPNLEGDRKGHLGKTGEHGHGISINGSSNVIVTGFQISDFWGDGIYVGMSNNKKGSVSIKLLNGIINNNRRNGISVTNVEDLLIDHVVCANSNGTMPMFGLDIEPNWSNNHKIKNVRIYNFFTYNNANGGMMVAVHKMAGNEKKNISIDVKNYKDEMSYHGFFFGGIPKNFNSAQGFLNLTNIVLEKNQIPIKLRGNQYVNSFKFNVVDLKVVNPVNKNYSTLQVNKIFKTSKAVINNVRSNSN